MKYPHFYQEKRLWREGYKMVVGIDEAGRGPLAGPVVAAAVSIEPISNVRKKLLQIGEIKDSKKLTEKKRERIFKGIVDHPAIRWGVGTVLPGVIDRINVLEATKMAMIRAILNLQRKYQHETFSLVESSGVNPSPYFLLVDGPIKLDLPLPQKSVLQGDKKVFSCSLASIIAKVKRDQVMKDLSEQYPEYNFEEHKGYATREHLEKLKEYGPCDIHRKSFNPVHNLFTEEA